MQSVLTFTLRAKMTALKIKFIATLAVGIGMIFYPPLLEAGRRVASLLRSIWNKN